MVTINVMTECQIGNQKVANTFKKDSKITTTITFSNENRIKLSGMVWSLLIKYLPKKIVKISGIS